LPEHGTQAVLESPELLPDPLRRGIPAGARDVLVFAAFLLVPITVAAILLADLAMGLSVLGGGFVALANFWLLSRIVVNTTGGELNGGVLFGHMMSKFVLLVASLGLVIVLLRLDAIGVLVGVGTIFPAILLGTLMDVFRDKTADNGVTN
jgi:hypothetical protein